MNNQEIKVMLVASPIGTPLDHKATVLGLGLKKIGQIKSLKHTPCVDGMINKVSYLVKVVS
jgi:large subunit ribosomal protein L30